MNSGLDSIGGSGSSANLDAILNKLRWQFEGIQIDLVLSGRIFRQAISSTKAALEPEYGRVDTCMKPYFQTIQ